MCSAHLVGHKSVPGERTASMAFNRCGNSSCRNGTHRRIWKNNTTPDLSWPTVYPHSLTWDRLREKIAFSRIKRLGTVVHPYFLFSSFISLRIHWLTDRPTNRLEKLLIPWGKSKSSSCTYIMCTNVSYEAVITTTKNRLDQKKHIRTLLCEICATLSCNGHIGYEHIEMIRFVHDDMRLSDMTPQYNASIHGETSSS